jgi:hypothetical protein
MGRAWIEYEDAQTKKSFWYNQQSQSGQFEMPPEVAELQKSGNIDQSKLKHKKSCMRLRKQDDWVEYNTEFGHIFYYHEKTGKFQWTDPHGDDDAAAHTNSNSPWRPYKDPSTGEIFWFNHETSVSQWDCPFENTRQSREDEAVVEVNEFSDLGI